MESFRGRSALASPTSDQAETPPSEIVAEGAAPLPTPLAKEVARYVFESSKFFKDSKKAKPQAFYPELHEGRYETSVCRLDEVEDARVWALGERARESRNAKALYGRFDLLAEHLEGTGLTLIPAPMIEFDEHHVIEGWPDPGEAKEAWKAVAVHLANRAKVLCTPPVPA
jgi:hypothetical protein